MDKNLPCLLLASCLLAPFLPQNGLVAHRGPLLAIFAAFLCAIAAAPLAQAEIIGVETFTYPAGPIAGQDGGIHWDFNNTTGTHTGTASDSDNVTGAPTVVDDRLVTENSSAKREYNGPDEGLPPSHEADGAVNGSNINKTVYYRVTCTTGDTLPNFFGLSSYDFGNERIFFGKRGGAPNFGLEISGGGASDDSTVAVQPNTTYTLVAKLSFDGDEIALFVDPHLAAGEPATPDAKLVYTGTNWSTAVRLASGGTGPTGAIQWDNLLVATTWEDIQPSGSFEFSPWTDDASSGIRSSSQWAYNLGSATGTTINGKTVGGVAGGNPSNADFDISGPGLVLPNDPNSLDTGGSATLANDFIFNGNPAVVTLKDLTPGETYVATFLSVGWDANQDIRRNTFSSLGDTRLIRQNEYGNNNGIRVDYIFKANSTTRDIFITPDYPGGVPHTWHHYGLALRQPSTLTVVNSGDAGPGSLRQAIDDALPGDTIDFDASLSGDTITLGGIQLLIDKSLTIDASTLQAGITINANQQSRVMEIESDTTVALHGLTLTGGVASGTSPDNSGGAIYNDHATLTVTGCSLTGNSASFGGGIYSNGKLSGNATLLVHASTLSGNSANRGGGIFSDGFLGSATLTVQASTLSGNSASLDGGGIYSNGISGNATLTVQASTLSGNSAADIGGGIFSTGSDGSATLTVQASTLSGNSAGGPGGGIFSNGSSNGSATLSLSACTLSGNSASDEGGGIYSGGAFGGSATLSLSNTILAGNTAPTGPDLREIAAGATTTATGTNLMSSVAGSNITGPPAEITIVANPKLAPLAHYGGPTMTMPPLPGSPAIDAAGTSTRTVDQRGFLITDGSPDIGAVEFRGGADLQFLWDIDHDGDGNPFGIEFTLGTDPFTADPGHSRNLTVGPDPTGDPVAKFGYNPHAAGLAVWVVDHSTDLMEWTEIFRSSDPPAGADTPQPGISTIFLDPLIELRTSEPDPDREFFRFGAEIIDP